MTILNIMKDSSIQKFDLKCQLYSTNLTCSLEFNITNYASSNQSVLVDYGDGSIETIYINSYCKTKLFNYLILNFYLKFSF